MSDFVARSRPMGQPISAKKTMCSPPPLPPPDVGAIGGEAMSSSISCDINVIEVAGVACNAVDCHKCCYAMTDV